MSTRAAFYHDQPGYNAAVSLDPLWAIGAIMAFFFVFMVTGGSIAISAFHTLSILPCTLSVESNGSSERDFCGARLDRTTDLRVISALPPVN